ncbi:ROK family protein [Marvinbryantia formatexigens DSM 14469]|uniref:Glucokinase n=1 Tax=Marvinbryantia formatexigens DSM 14469 TaxID=478749 RepID=C6LH16_9FIRM|nr:ROK family glucokinase [Marvinbryantia formatexigens]EET60075.1 ROK family protein [Marvinbryantia formatexigens DSM 14469]UWO23867.1 ROK family glucokinase [Marvinbryantia formatexigens DSM 14469]SDG51117.1 glucokinase [Marvinbryantia formatexigens]
MKKYCFGIDVGGTTVKCGLFDVKGTVLDKWEIKTRTENNGCNILPDVADTISDKIREKNLDRDEIAGIGLGVPGPVNEEGEVPAAVNLHWGYVHLVDQMERLTGLNVKAGNDANVAALGEMWKGGGAGYHNVVLVTLGTGVGGGIINNGQIVTGTHGAGGEIGHIHVTDSLDVNCNCGNCGCLEQVASATGITFLAKRRLEKDDAPSVLRRRNLSAKSVFDAVKEGDAVAVEIAEEFGHYLGTALANVAGITDPDIFVIGGGVSKAGPILLEFIQKYYKQYAFMACKETPFALAELGNDAGIYGAAKLVL